MVIKSREPSRKELASISNGKFVVLVWFVVNFFFLFSCSNPLITQIAEPKTVTFETNGGSHIEEQIVYLNYPIIKPQSPVKNNYKFDNWYSENVNFATPWNFNTILETDITLYANWIPLYTYTVSFDKNGGDIDSNPAVIEVTPNTKITAPYNPPVKAGYGFTGWYKEAACITEWSFTTDIVTDDMTLYAKWKENTVVVTLSMETITGNQAPNIPAVTISRAGAGGNPIFYLVIIDPSLFDTGSITWRISGVGAYAGTFITDDNDSTTGIGEFSLNANDTRYNALGAHTLLLEVKKNGIAYQTNIKFTVVE